MRHPRRNYARAPAFIPEDPGLGMPMLCPSQNSIPGYGTATCEMCRGDNLPCMLCRLVRCLQTETRKPLSVSAKMK